MGTHTLSFQQSDRSTVPLTGGKGANLGELSRITGLHVPDGFCITTNAYTKIIESTPGLSSLLNGLTDLQPEERMRISAISAAIRTAIENRPIPSDIAEEITTRLQHFPASQPFAVRSSATAEDLPSASFAGQQDSYLNITGKTAILRHISLCWASLFTDRAVTYRIQNGFDHRKVHLAVIIQKMIHPQAAGVLFTADPLTGNRKISSIEATPGLGEALVSGLLNPDAYQLHDDKIIEKKRSTESPTLADKQIFQLARLGRQIEQHFGRPQDIEWCLAGDIFYFVQSRPITTLFPIPETNDRENHVYISVGHQQMMTDAIRPFGLSFFLLTTQATMYKAGGRLFVDIMKNLSSPATQQKTIQVLGGSDPVIKDALTTLIEREEFIKPTPDDINPPGADYNTPPVPDNHSPPFPYKSNKVLSWTYPENFEDVKAIVAGLMESNTTSLETLQRNIRTRSGTDLFDFILEDIPQLKKTLFSPKSLDVIMVAMHASAWLNEKMKEWLGEINAADSIAQSAPNNITAEMGLELLEVADIIRPYPDVSEYLQNVKDDDDFLDHMTNLKGGKESRDSISAWLTKYGMRCAGEIDITKTRWAEKPSTLISMILNNITNAEPNAGKQRFEQGLQNARRKEQELLDRLRPLPDGDTKVKEAKRTIGLIRDLTGYREYPKYAMICRYFVYKQALLREIDYLEKTKVIRKKEDAYFLSFEELREAVHTRTLDYQLIDNRKDEYRLYQKMTPPRVMTSDGEIITGKYNRENLPPNAIAGLAVSSGTIEGRARVILNIQDANLRDGDILVTTFTDPGWTPVFVSIKGLVTEVGGLMTHGAVIAREYGLPAVVGVENATHLIKDGQRIRVNGTDGYVEFL
jgi:rifampicin phosphotransferase